MADYEFLRTLEVLPRTLRQIAGDAVDGTSVLCNAKFLNLAAHEIERLRAAVRDSESQLVEWRAIATQKQQSQG